MIGRKMYGERMEGREEEKSKSGWYFGRIQSVGVFVIAVANNNAGGALQGNLQNTAVLSEEKEVEFAYEAMPEGSQSLWSCRICSVLVSV
ncbi:unnamed protein product [Litomosoides sigmodontis]|uniref:Uncharacterized protein n=1 Tax=Litomosoides sigmodontis TaxID=42156 RepID=A0A3P6UIV3_LITSI|nr:unnamed protein product [Litomosoides sigmodontis]